MNNNNLKKDLETFIGDKFNLSVTKSTIGGVSIDIFNKKTNEDIGTYLYSSIETRDADFLKLKELIG